MECAHESWNAEECGDTRMTTYTVTRCMTADKTNESAAPLGTEFNEDPMSRYEANTTGKSSALTPAAEAIKFRPFRHLPFLPQYRPA